MCILCAFVISLCAHSVLMIFSYPAVVHASCFAVLRLGVVCWPVGCMVLSLKRVSVAVFGRWGGYS